MANRNISATVQIGATMSSSVGSVFGGITKKVNDLGASLAKLKRQSADIGRLQTAQTRLSDAQGKGNAAAVARYSEQVKKLSESLRAAGVDTSRLAHEQSRLAAQIASTESSLGRMTRLSGAWSGFKSNLMNVGTAFGKVKDNVGGLAAKMAVLGTATGYLFKTQFLDTAAEFEKMQTVLKTLEGGNVAKAKQAFGWINDFAAKTPYDLKTVTEAFVKLRSYGIDPIKGDTLRSLGDTASAMGKSVMDAVEAIADAVTGENERLKEFGIKAAKDGDKITYTYTNRAGKQRQKVVDGTNREIIRSTLTAIWNEKYAGAMDEQSRTWNGMISNVGDQWTRFTARVMAAGVFDWMKSKLSGVLDELNRAADDGRLKKWAEETGAAIKSFFINAWELGKSIRDVAVATADFFGGWKNLGMILGAVVLAPTITSMIQLGVAIGGVLGPWGLLATAVIGAGIAIYHYRDEIKSWMDQHPKVVNAILDALGPLGLLISHWDDLTAAVKMAKDMILPLIQSIGDSFDWLSRKMGGIFDSIAPQGSKSRIMMDLLTGSASLNPLMGPARFLRKPLTTPESMPQTSNTSVKQDFQINVTAPPNQDPRSFGERIIDAMKREGLYDVTNSHLVPQ